MKNAPVLVVGNSPNQLGNGKSSWSALIAELRRISGMKSDGHQSKPFPLHFEEIRNRYLKNIRGATDQTFLNTAAQKLKELEVNDVHRELMKLSVSDILTTNFDDCLERATGSAKRDNFDTNESKYSLFRRWSVGNHYIWHVHGDLFHPTSIILGHDRYIESCARIRRYIDGSEGVRYSAYPEGLKARFKSPMVKIKPSEPHSWLDLLMTRDVHIAGLGMDFTEIDWWYLLSYKEKVGHSKDSWKRKLGGRRVVVHMFDDSEHDIMPRTEILRSFGVEVRQYKVRNKNYRPAWDSLLKVLQSEIS